MALDDFEPTTDGPFERSLRCTCTDECPNQPVVREPDGSPLCFRGAFVAALASDEEAQKLALGWSVGHAYSERFIKQRRG